MRRSVLLLGGILGVACMAALAAGGITVKVKGTFRDGVYTSPDNGFSVRMPDLTRPGIVVQDELASGGEAVVYFRDDFCRQYYVHATPLIEPYVSEAEVERYARDGVAVMWAQTKQATLESLAPVDIGRGPAVALRQRQPSGPCSVMTFEGGKMVKAPVPADVLTYIFVADGAVYEVGLVRGETDEGMSFFTGEPKPLEEALGAFVKDLETRQGARKLQKNGLRQGISTKVAGKFEGAEYLAADGSYRLKLPPLYGSAQIEELGDTVPGETMLVLEDMLCRSYLVHRMPMGKLTDEQLQQLGEAMGQHFVDQESGSNLVVEPLDLGRGEGTALQIRYERPPARCDTASQRPEVVPSDVTIYLFREGDITYEIAYARARLAAAPLFFTRREPPDELLRELIAGLRGTN